MEKSCINCGHRLVGRTDKKFCDNGCRYTFHNRLNSEKNNEGRRLLYAARKNFRILEQLASEGKSKVSRRELEASGFNFLAVTGVYQKAGDKQCLKVFDMALEETSTGYRIGKRI